jgi:diguanylate cyclase
MRNNLLIDEREKAAVLIVDDNIVDRILISELVDVLAPYSLGEMLQANSCEEAQQLLKKYQPSCCLIDYMMPGANGSEFIKAIREEEHNQHIPIIMMTGEGNEKVAVDIMRNGAQDYLVKGDITKDLLNHSIKNAIHTCQLQCQLQYLAHYDTLTGLLNRALFLDRLQSAIDKCDRYQHRCSVLYIDVDNFKQVNDNYGHHEGDEILKAVAARMKASCRNTDSPARLGGDEFAILLDCIDEEHTNKTAEKILREVSQPIVIGEHSLTISLSIGVAYYPKTATNMQELLQQADEAMYQAKQSGKAGFSYFSKEHDKKWMRSKQLEMMLPLAIKNNELFLAYQPIVRSKDQSLYGLEVLARWAPSGFTVTAQELMDLIEKLKLFDDFHMWLVNTALSQYALWNTVGQNIQYCLNIPANHAHSEGFIHCLNNALKTYQIEPFHISLEITEKTLMNNLELSCEFVSSLQGEGVQCSLEDFGAGNISMSHLSTLPLSVLKIDHQFISGIHEKKANRKVVEAMTALGHSLGLSVVAEGIETEEEYNVVAGIGCDLMQGFYFGKPAMAIDIWNGFFSKSTADAESDLLASFSATFPTTKKASP